MAKTVITLVGISLLENVLTKRQQLRSLGMPSADHVSDLIRRCKSNRLTPERAAALNDPLAGETAERFRRALTGLWESTEPKYTVDGGRRKRMYSPGELASLSLFDLGPEDKIVLLYSETGEGAFCAAVLEQLLRAGVGVPAGVQVDKRMIEGLQVEDLRRFTDEGVVNYVQVIDRIVADQDKDTQVIMNITGGYKGVAPIATIVALELGVEVCYLYEESDELLYLPPLEVEFGYSMLFTGYQNIMEQITPATSPLPTASADEFWGKVLRQDRGQLEKHVETIDGKVRLSPLGVLAWTLHTLKGKIGGAEPRGSLKDD